MSDTLDIEGTLRQIEADLADTQLPFGVAQLRPVEGAGILALTTTASLNEEGFPPDPPPRPWPPPDPEPAPPPSHS